MASVSAKSLVGDGQIKSRIIKIVGIARKASSQGDTETVWRLMKQVKPRLHQRPSLWTLFKNYWVTANLRAHKLDWRKLETVCMDINREPEFFRMDLRAYTSVIAYLGKHRNMVPAVKYIWDLMLQEGFQPDAVAYNALLLAFQQDFGEVDTILRLMRKLNIEPTRATYSILLRQLVNGKRYEDAWAILAKMDESGVEVTSENIKDWMWYCSMRGRIMSVDRGYEELQRRQLPMLPDIMESIIGVHCVRQQMTTAENVFRQVRAKYPDVDTTRSWAKLIQGYGRCGRLEHAVSLLGEMSRQSTLPNGRVYDALLEAYVANDRLDLAPDLLAQVESEGRKLSNKMILLLLRAHTRMENAPILGHLREMLVLRNRRIDVYTYHQMLEFYCAQSDIRAAEDLFQEMVDARGYTAYASTMMMEAYASRHMASRMLKVFRTMLKAGVEPSERSRELIDIFFTGDKPKIMIGSPALVEMLNDATARLDDLRAKRRRSVDVSQGLGG